MIVELNDNSIQLYTMIEYIMIKPKATNKNVLAVIDHGQCSSSLLK